MVVVLSCLLCVLGSCVELRAVCVLGSCVELRAVCVR